MTFVEIALLALVSLALVLEAWALITGRRPITGAARADAQMWLVWPYAWGVLASHFWSPWRSLKFAWLIMGAMALFIIAHDIHGRIDGTKHAKWEPFAALVVGLVMGLLWSRGY